MTNLFGPGVGACHVLPLRASDAGPETEAMDWKDHLYDASTAAELARSYRLECNYKERDRELSLRRAAIQSAREALDRAEAALVEAWR